MVLDRFFQAFTPDTQLSAPAAPSIAPQSLPSSMMAQIASPSYALGQYAPSSPASSPSPSPGGSCKACSCSQVGGMDQRMARLYKDCTFPEVFSLIDDARGSIPMSPLTKIPLCADYHDFRAMLSLIQLLGINVNQNQTLAGAGLGNTAAFTTNTNVTLAPSNGLPFVSPFVGIQVKGNDNVSRAVGRLKAEFYEFNGPQSPHVEDGTVIGSVARTGVCEWHIEFSKGVWDYPTDSDFPFHAVALLTKAKDTGLKELSMALNAVNAAQNDDYTQAAAKVRSLSPLAPSHNFDGGVKFTLTGMPADAGLDVSIIYPGTTQWRIAKGVIDATMAGRR